MQLIVALTSLMLAAAALVVALYVLFSESAFANRSKFRLLEEECSRLWEALDREARRYGGKKAAAARAARSGESPDVNPVNDRDSLLSEFENRR